MNYAEKILDKTSSLIEEIITDKSFLLRTDPFILILVSILMAFLVAFTNSYILVLLSLPILVFIYSLLPINHQYFFKISLIIALLGTIPGVPIIFTEKGYIHNLNDFTASPTIHGLESFVLFVSRVIVSSTFFLLPVIGLGWYGFLKNLSRIKPIRTILSMIALIIVVLPRILRNTISILLAREARIMDKNYGILWRTLSSTIGDTIILSHQYSKILTKAILARTMSNEFFYIRKNYKQKHSFSLIDASLVIGSTLYTILYLLVELSWLKMF